jgi:hypothetical protein
MPKKTLHALVGSDRLRVENTWFSGATLFMNDQPIARNNGLFAASSQTPLMSAEATVNGSKSQIEVFVRAIFTVKIQIRLNGTIVAGEEL